ncbi:MAG: RNA methyltransferase [Prevotellaceae bacterium]|jgi:tRNA G18 (ribose-2'-O)-methylase SpoU|nr:RNA methyltransferase [Prevotellaceae bacterium]
MNKKTKITEMNRLSAEEFKQAEKIPLVVVLDNVRSMNNIGSVFRTADAFRVKKIYLCGITSTPPNAEIHKTALGAEYSMDWAYVEETLQAVEELKRGSYTVFCVEQARNSISLPNLQMNAGQKYAIVLGNEVKGVAQEVIDASDGCIEIPQYGTKHSLNVSVAGGIVMWECFMKLA